MPEIFLKTCKVLKWAGFDRLKRIVRQNLQIGFCVSN